MRGGGSDGVRVCGNLLLVYNKCCVIYSLRVIVHVHVYLAFVDAKS